MPPLHKLLALIATVTIAQVAAPVPAMRGQIIEARATTSSTLYLWDATPYVIELVHQHILGDPGLRALEATAVTALGGRARTSRSSGVVLRIVFQKTADVSPIYGTPTFAGVEVVAILSARAKEVARNARVWASQLAKGQKPKGLAVQITGKLPPQP